MMRKVMGLISWIMTGVSLFFLLVIMLAFPVALFAVSDEAPDCSRFGHLNRYPPEPTERVD